MHSPDDPYAIADALEIYGLLRTLLTRKILLRMVPNTQPEATITTVLAIDRDKNSFMVDAGADPHTNQRLLKAATLYFDSIIDNVSVQFAIAGAQLCQHADDGGTAICLPLPTIMRRLQRRDHFRVDTLISAPLFCEISTAQGPALRLPVKNISAGGLALIDNERFITETATVLEHCLLELDHIGSLIANLRVLRITEAAPGSNAPRIVACQFENPVPGNTILLQNYINSLQRLLRARQRGLD